MYVKSVYYKNFRNYSILDLKLNDGLNVFTGENAQGKTNIIEGIYLSSCLKSHRTSKDRELIKWNNDKAYVKVYAEKKYENTSVEILLSSDDKKAVKVNGVKLSRFSDAVGNINAVIFSPEDLKLLKDGPAVRRKFIDNEISQTRPKYHYALLQYNRILMQRNNLLKFMNKSTKLRTEIEVFSEQLAEYGSFIIQARYEYIKKLSLIARLIHRKITDGNEEIEVSYQSDSYNCTDKSEIKNYLLKYYTESLNEDIEKGYTLKGPHRDDILIKINGIDARVYGSQGQQRSSALSLKLSELEIIKSEVGEYPILLLDDVLSELDNKRQTLLINSLQDVQTIITCTSINEVKEYRFKSRNIFKVEGGTVEKIE